MPQIHTCPKDFVENRNISNILEEAPLCARNWNLWGSIVGARDFSPDWKHRDFGTEVPCPDGYKHQFIELRTQTLGHMCPKKRFFKSVIDKTFQYADNVLIRKRAFLCNSPEMPPAATGGISIYNNLEIL